MSHETRWLERAHHEQQHLLRYGLARTQYGRGRGAVSAPTTIRTLLQIPLVVAILLHPRSLAIPPSILLHPLHPLHLTLLPLSPLLPFLLRPIFRLDCLCAFRLGPCNDVGDKVDLTFEDGWAVGEFQVQWNLIGLSGS